MKRSLIVLLALCSLASAAAPSKTISAGPRSETRHLTLLQLGNKEVYKLRNTDGQTTLNFGFRADELATRAVLHLHYSYSPALIPLQSHIRVLLNEQVVGVLPVTRENGGQPLIRDIPVDPRLISDFNRLTLQFIAHYSNDSCEDPLNSSLWADISGESSLDITLDHLALKNDLALLPEPFFDHRDLNRVTLPLIFAASPTRQTLTAAGVVASWFGKLADWRGSRFPAHLDDVPAGHGIVFATNESRPAFLRDHPAVTGPSLEIMTNPVDGYSKLLVLWGRNDADLKTAALALVLGHTAASGAHVGVTDVKEEIPRAPYDAPRWVRIDRPMKFGELVNSPQDLQVFGHVPNPIVLNLRIPPDLFAWRSRGIPVDLKFRYTPPIRSSESRLIMSINDEMVQAFNLMTSGQGGEHRVRLPLIDSALFGAGDEVFIPAYKLGARDQLRFDFTFAYQKEGFCKDTQVENVRAMVDDDSTIDMSGFPHYAEMPNLAHFSTLGFPFTRYADLSQTVIVLPEKPTVYDLETMFTLLGRMGEATGYPATRFTLASPADEGRFANADLLVIGEALQQGIFKSWHDRMPADVSAQSRRINQPQRGVNLFYDWLGFGTKPDTAIASEERLTGSGPLAVMMGFESPLTSERNVVAVTAAGPEQLRLVLDALEKPALIQNFRGSVTFVHPDRVDSLLVGNTYFIGHLPLWTAIWFPLSGHPILIALMGSLAVLVFAFALLRSLRVIAARRLKRKGKA